MYIGCGLRFKPWFLGVSFLSSNAAQQSSLTCCTYAAIAQLVDAQDLGSCALWRGGSIPPLGNIMSNIYTVICSDSTELFLGIFDSYSQARSRAENFLEHKRKSLTVKIYLSKVGSNGSHKDLLTTLGGESERKPVPIPRRVY